MTLTVVSRTVDENDELIYGRARPDSIAEPDVLDNLASFIRHLQADEKHRRRPCVARCFRV